MPRTLAPAFVREKNQVESTHVITLAFALDIAGAPVSYRLVNYDQDVVFQGLLFTRSAIEVSALEDASSQALTTIRLTAQNVDQEFISLLENYWGPDTPWTVTIWQLDTAQPDVTTVADGEVFTVMQVSTDLLTATADLMASGLTLSSMLPRRRYTRTSGFQKLPRRMR